MKKRESWEFLKDLYVRFGNDDLLSTGAQVAFFLLLSLFPFLIFLVTLVSYVQIVDVQDSIQALAALMPASAYEILRDIVSETIADRSGTLLSLGVLFALWSSTSGVTSLMRGANRAYDQEETRRFWRIKAISLGFTLELAVVIAVSFVLIVLGRDPGNTDLSTPGLLGCVSRHLELRDTRHCHDHKHSHVHVLLSRCPELSAEAQRSHTWSNRSIHWLGDRLYLRSPTT